MWALILANSTGGTTSRRGRPRRGRDALRQWGGKELYLAWRSGGRSTLADILPWCASYLERAGFRDIGAEVLRDGSESDPLIAITGRR